ncbi:MAG TPA: hypothetical protein PLX18_11370 [Anaerohalosphaeraceae bacterium]|nr:hypothetical protein [Anaerohalosphaeraceae bacterium]HQG06866.1 hypothetical protein [Anaerohalosphaeraceae bacterium]HQI08441.1 hypothetical protein [Anaerohalosphaeraceae bacterium]HQJ68760.1 hypothetical protein [Anaerohalosphaeraceae bacterium]
MNPLQEEKVTLMLAEVKNNDAFGTQTPLDLSGCGVAKIEIIVGPTDVAVGSGGTSTPLVLEECDTNSGTPGDWSVITKATLTSVISATDDNKIFAIDVPNIPGRKRYVRVKAPTAGSGTTGAFLVIRGVTAQLAVGPSTAADRGYAQHITA